VDERLHGFSSNFVEKNVTVAGKGLRLAALFFE
jgi:hypothetical protein